MLLYASVQASVRAVPNGHIEGSQAFLLVSFFIFFYILYPPRLRTAAYMPASTEGIIESFGKNRKYVPET